MRREDFEKLGPGDIVQHVSGGKPAVVTVNYGDRMTAVRTEDLTNPDEWVLLRKVISEHRDGRSVR